MTRRGAPRRTDRLPPADLAITGIGEVLDYELPALLGAATGVAAARRTVTDVDP